MANFDRRNPGELLDAIKRADDAYRGKLRVFLGMCPGVGKTYSMLEAARQQARRGVHVLVGVVECHGRKDTEALLEGLEIVPRREFIYKTAKLSEMDLDQILDKKPSLVLVDELAHTNAPGSRHAKRYQDIEELLHAGIDVYTTLNIQHLESRNDQVAQITGIRVRETVPDSFLELADPIEVVDLAPKELLRRLAEGKVYLGDRAEQAAGGFFKEEQLLALRELALRFVAERVDQDLKDQMTIKGIKGPWNTNERLLVAVSHSPYSARLIRTTRRMAYNLEAPWIALYVNTGEGLTYEDEVTLQRNIALARELGAEVVTISDMDVAHAIGKVSQDRNVTQIVMGRPDRRFIKDLLAQGTLLDKLVRETSKIDIHVIRAERKPKYRGWLGWFLRRPRLQSGLVSYYYTCWFIGVVSFISSGLIDFIGYRALGSIFLLAILTVASISGAGPTLFAAVVSAVVWNFFFIPPTWTFSISAPEDVMMLASFFVAALVSGILTARIRRQGYILKTREGETQVLYEFVRKVSDANDVREVVAILNQTIQRHFNAGSGVLLPDKENKLTRQSAEGRPIAEKEVAIAEWVYTNGKPAGWSTQTLSAGSCFCLPMKGNSGVVGVVAFFPPAHSIPLSVESENFLAAIVAQAAIVLERMKFMEAARTAQLMEASEKLHQTLLNSVSHELRTPITALIGSATALDDERTVEDAQARKILTKEIIAAGKRLDRVVENLLDLSRLEKGSLQLKNEWFELNDLFSLLKTKLAGDINNKKLRVDGDTHTLLEGDFQLLEHALSHVVMNALKYGDGGNAIEISTHARENSLKIFVRDEGPGIPEGLETKIFEKFYRAPRMPAGGLGLGLSIVKNIIELHGGEVFARNRKDKTGAEFEISLPLKTPPSALREALS